MPQRVIAPVGKSFQPTIVVDCDRKAAENDAPQRTPWSPSRSRLLDIVQLISGSPRKHLQTSKMIQRDDGIRSQDPCKIVPF